MQGAGQPIKHEASDLTFLYDFVSECPNPSISEAIKKLVAGWLADPTKVPHLPTAIKAQLALTNEELVQVGWRRINPLTTPSVLEDLCTKGSAEILEQIAENRNTCASTLGSLSLSSTCGNPHSSRE